jgi:hypothetical protein
MPSLAARLPVRLACLIRAASVRSEPGSNSPSYNRPYLAAGSSSFLCTLPPRRLIRTAIAALRHQGSGPLHPNPHTHYPSPLPYAVKDLLFYPPRNPGTAIAGFTPPSRVLPGTPGGEAELTPAPRTMSSTSAQLSVLSSVKERLPVKSIHNTFGEKNQAPPEFLGVPCPT